jgi:hypothetical protein
MQGLKGMAPHWGDACGRSNVAARAGWEPMHRGAASMVLYDPDNPYGYGAGMRHQGSRIDWHPGQMPEEAAEHERRLAIVQQVWCAQHGWESMAGG